MKNNVYIQWSHTSSQFLTNVHLPIGSLIRQGMRGKKLCEDLQKERKNAFVTPIHFNKEKKKNK